MKETTLYIARHGKTLWNDEKRMQGHKGIGLSGEGYQQAEELARDILKNNYPITVIYSSHLERAWQTADVVAEVLNLPVQIHPGLAERKLGEFEGKTVSELEKLHTNGGLWWDLTPAGGESTKEFRSRTIMAVKDILKKENGKHIFIVSHGGTIRIIKEYFSGQAPELNDVGFEIENAFVWIHKIK